MKNFFGIGIKKDDRDNETEQSGDTDVPSQLRKIRQQLGFLERKIDMLLDKGNSSNRFKRRFGGNRPGHGGNRGNHGNHNSGNGNAKSIGNSDMETLRPDDRSGYNHFEERAWEERTPGTGA